MPLLALGADMSNTVPDEKVTIAYVSFLCARLLDLSAELRAASRIQRVWRRHTFRVKVCGIRPSTSATSISTDPMRQSDDCTVMVTGYCQRPRGRHGGTSGGNGSTGALSSSNGD